MRICSIKSCERKYSSKGYCARHYYANKRTGDPLYLPRKLHGMSNTRTYTSWESMIGRCHNPNDDYYDKYGGSNILVCKEWRKSFIKFYEDMGERPSKMSLDRIDNTKGYSKDNCRWATRSLQQANRKPRSNTGYLGVSFSGGKYHAQITKDRKHYNLGEFHILQEAIEARRIGEIKVWGQKLEDLRN